MTDRDFTEHLVEKYLGEEIKSLCKKHVDSLQNAQYDDDGLLKLCEHEFSHLIRTISHEMNEVISNYGFDLPLVRPSNPMHKIMQDVFLKFCNEWLDYVIVNYIRYTLLESISEQFEQCKERSIV